MANVRYQVFVSSTYEDLVEERKQVTQAILESDCFPAGMELFPASNESQWDFIKQVIDESDIYLVVIAGRYGSLNEDKNISYTEMEFDYAMATNKPIIVLIHNNISDLPTKKVESTDKGRELLKAFTTKAKKGRLVKFWSNKDDIKSAVLYSLNQIKGRLPNCGWIKANTEGIPISGNDVEDLKVANDKLSKELQDTERSYSTLSHAYQILRDELHDIEDEKSELEKELNVNKEILTKTINENSTLKMAKDNCDRLSNELSHAKAKINELEKELKVNKESLAKTSQENATLKMAKGDCEKLSNKLSQAKARINELEKELKVNKESLYYRTNEQDIRYLDPQNKVVSCYETPKSVYGFMLPQM